MPAYYKFSDGSEGGGGERYSYRGRGRGGRHWGGRDGGGGGGRGYSHGGSRYSSDRYKWNEGGGRQGTYGGGYRNSSYSQSRYRNDPSSSHPWDSGSGSGMGNMMERGEGTSDLLRSLGHLSGKESKIAMDIMNAVLSSDSSVGEARDWWDNGSPARKMRRMDWDGARPPPMYKNPQRDRHFSPRRTRDSRGRGSHTRSLVDYRKMSKFQLWKIEMARLEMPRPDEVDNKDTEEKASATAAGKREVREEEQEKATADGENTPADADMKESDSPDVASKEEEQPVKQEKVDDSEEKSKQEQEHTEVNEDTSIVIPRAALKCHMCDISKFPHTKAYLSHLESKNHKLVGRLFHARNAAVIDVLMADTELACKQKPKKRGGSKRCLMCDCYMSSTMREHCQTIEHTLVSHYSRVHCCGYRYYRAIVEEHRLSLRHLKNQLDVDEENKKLEQKEMEEEEARREKGGFTGVAAFHEEVYRLKMSHESEEELTPSTLPPHDPTKPIGLNFLYKKKLYRCEVCHSHFRNPRHIECHFRSIDHYYNLCRHLTELEEEKELERKRLEEKVKKEQDSKTKENIGDEDVNCEDMNNMETVDEAEEDVDVDANTGDDGGVATRSENLEHEGGNLCTPKKSGVPMSVEGEKKLQGKTGDAEEEQMPNDAEEECDDIFDEDECEDNHDAVVDEEEVDMNSGAESANDGGATSEEEGLECEPEADPL